MKQKLTDAEFLNEHDEPRAEITETRNQPTRELIEEYRSTGCIPGYGFRDAICDMALAHLASGGWISVDERLPMMDEEVNYLSVIGDRGTTHALNIRAAWNSRLEGEECFYSAWQPLPPLPKEGE